MSPARAVTLLAAAALLPAPACGSLLRVPSLPPVPAEVIGRAFTPEEAARDLEHLFAVIEEVHPDPYRHVARAEVQELRAALLAGLDRPLTRRELQPRFAELVARLGDGHTSVHLPLEEFWADPAGGASALPLAISWDAGRLLVTGASAVTPDGALGPGARVLELCGRPAEELVRTFLARTSGESEAFRVAGVEQAFAVHLWLEGCCAPFHARVASALDPAQVFEVDLPGMPWGSALPRTAAGGDPWRLERRPDGVALLALDTFARDPEEFEAFLERTFQELADEPPAALVIDLTRNGGGDSRLGDELLQYLSDRPWRQAARKEWKVSAPLERHLKGMLPAWLRWLPVQYLHPVGRKLWGTPEGELAVFESPRVPPRDEPLRYRGPLAWLIGPSTFSAAMGLATAAQDCGRGLLVGQETGGVQDGFGEVIPFRLPRTQLGVQVSTAYFWRSERRSGGGVQPDIAVPPLPGGRDAALETAIAALLAPAR